MPKRLHTVELMTLAYFLCYLPYIMVTRHLSTQDQVTLGRPLTGLEILPGMLIVAALLTLVFCLAMGWFKNVRRVQVGPFSLPLGTRDTMLQGLCTAVILVTVPISYTLVGVSIPLIQLLMRGDILIIAPLVDKLNGRVVHWWSWAALALVLIGMVVAFLGRGDLAIGWNAVAVVVIYTAAYFGRLLIMTKISKDGEIEKVKTIFLEEKIVGFPLALAALGILGLFAQFLGGGDEVRLGFVAIWTMPEFGVVAFCGAMVFLTGIFATFILLDARENSFCVPLERSASILAGVIGSIWLAQYFGGRMPSQGEFIGAGLMVVAILVLSFGPRISKAAA
jgi:hypothetical protein